MARHKNTRLRSTMTQRCCSLPILHCHKEGPDNLDLAAVINVFISK